VIDAAHQLGRAGGERMERAVAQLHLGRGSAGRLEPVRCQQRLGDGERALGAETAGPRPGRSMAG
jgi:hypothetical protein